MFLLDVKEVHDLVWANENVDNEVRTRSDGEPVKKIFEPDFYIGTPTQDAVEDTSQNFKDRWKPTTGNKWNYWLRFPNARSACHVRAVNSDDHVDSDWASRGHLGVRPAFYLSDTAPIVYGDGTANNPYVAYRKAMTEYGDFALPKPAKKDEPDPITNDDSLTYTGAAQELIKSKSVTGTETKLTFSLDENGEY